MHQRRQTLIQGAECLERIFKDFHAYLNKTLIFLGELLDNEIKVKELKAKKNLVIVWSNEFHGELAVSCVIIPTLRDIDCLLQKSDFQSTGNEKA